MSKVKHKESKSNIRHIRWIIAVVILGIAAGSIYYFTTAGKSSGSLDGPGKPSIDNPQEQALHAPDATGAEHGTPGSVTRPITVDIKPDTLIGRWYRTDGEYMIEVTGISADGRVQAGYFNPRPIHVSRAESYPEQPPRLFVELQDAGYDGSNYNLTYDAQNDVLRGSYYQATYGQTYTVIFMRGNQ